MTVHRTIQEAMSLIGLNAQKISVKRNAARYLNERVEYLESRLSQMESIENPHPHTITEIRVLREQLECLRRATVLKS